MRGSAWFVYCPDSRFNRFKEAFERRTVTVFKRIACRKLKEELIDIITIAIAFSGVASD